MSISSTLGTRGIIDPSIFDSREPNPPEVLDTCGVVEFTEEATDPVAPEEKTKSIWAKSFDSTAAGSKAVAKTAVATVDVSKKVAVSFTSTGKK